MSYEESKQRISKFTHIVENIAVLVGEKNGDRMLDSGGTEFQPGINMTQDAADLRQKALDLQKGTFRILVMGEFKNGKSTILNAMLGEEILPAKVTPATAVITVIVGGNGKLARIYEHNGDNVVMRELGISEFKNEFSISKDDQETLRNKNKLDRFANVQFVEMESTYPLVQNNVSLIDSPGLAERASRTKVTRDYLTKVQALVLVLRADQILSEDEREFIQQLNSRRLEHVFILVNRIDLISEDEIDGLKDFVQTTLSEYYCKPDSEEFDEQLYRRRVFYTSAKKALDARCGKYPDPAESRAALASSNLEAFEKELETFLTTEEHLYAALSTSMFVTAGKAQRAVLEIESKLASMNNSLEDLVARKKESDEKLEALGQELHSTEQQIKRYEQIASRRVFESLTRYIRTLPETWEQDSTKVVNLNGAIKIFEITKGVFSDEAKRKINDAIGVEIDKYIDIKFSAWSLEASKEVEKVMHEMAEDIRYKLEDFEAKLNNIVLAFSGAKPKGLLVQNDEGGTKVIKLGLLAGYWLFMPSAWSDVGMVTGMMWNKFDVRRLMKNVLAQVGVMVGVMVVSYFFGGPVMWAALIAAQAFRGIDSANQTKKEIRKRIGEELFKQMNIEAGNMQKSIDEEMRKTFGKASDDILKSLRAEIERVQNNQRETIEMMRGEQRSIDAERVRLSKIHGALNAKIEEASEIVFKQKKTLKELTQKTINRDR